jgi:multiple sugar transport system substrate-binding protein
LVVGAALAATAFSGPAVLGQSPAAGPQTLVVWTRNYTVADGQPSPFRDAKTKFEADHPGVTVELSGVGYDDQYNRLLLSLAGSIQDRPDVYLADNIWLGQFTENGLSANLDAYYDAWTGKDDIIDAYRDSTKWDGSQHGVWAYSDIRTLIWNKAVFAAAGLDPEKGPTTWDEVMTDAAAIKDKVPGVVPVGFPAASQEGTVDRFYSYLFMTGSNILNADDTKAVFNDEGGQKAVQFLVDLINKGYTTQDVLNQDADAIQNALYAGKYGIMLATVGDGFGSRPEGMTADQFKQTIGAALPATCDGCQPASTAGGWMLGINDASPLKDLAWDYIMDVTDGPNMVPFEANNVRVPVRKSGLALADQFRAVDPYFDVSAQALDVAHFPPFVAQYTAMIEPIWTGIQTAIQGTPVKDALDQAASDVDAILAPQ